MSKQQDDDLPPPYTPSSSASNAPVSPTSLTSQLSTHLSSLPARIRATQAAHTTSQAAYDAELVALLVPHLEAFLADLGALPHAPPLAELTLVPAAAVSPLWAMTGAAERRREGEVVRCVRVANDSKAQGEKGSYGAGKLFQSPPQRMPGDVDLDDGSFGDKSARTRSREFDEWGRWKDDDGSGSPDAGGGADSDAAWWFRDEAMARRLAGYLQPRADGPVRTERRQIQAVVEKAREDKKAGWGWNRRKAGEDSGVSRASGEGAVTGGREAAAEERITMSVRAQEVTFRRENDFGLWESMSGFGVVATIKIKRP